MATVKRVGLLSVGSRSGRRRHMYVSVIHHISDPEGFRAAEQRALEAVRELVESVVGEYSENEYFETKVDGLPAS
jgi:hypothetical protein